METLSSYEEYMEVPYRATEYTLEERVDLRSLRWLKTVDVSVLKTFMPGAKWAKKMEAKKGDLEGYLKLASFQDDGTGASQTSRKYFPNKSGFGRMGSSSARDLFVPFKAYLFGGRGTDADQVASASTSLVWLVTKFPLRHWTCDGLNEFA
jgi:hypothetical protein